MAFFVELAWIGAFAWRLHFNEADQGLMNRHREVGPRLQMLHGGFANELHRGRRHTAKFGKIAQQRFQRIAQLVFGRAGYRRIGQLGLRRCAE